MSAARRHPPYAVLSRVYDEWLAQFDYATVANAVLDAAPATPGRRPRCLDLCTGTGSLLVELAARDVDVWGVDRSEPMLRIAREKLAQPTADDGGDGAPARLTAAAADDASRWPALRFDLVTCTADSVNYLDAVELRRALAGAHAALEPGGALVFDVNSPRKLHEVFGDSSYGEAHERYAYVWRNRLAADRRSIEFDIAIFLREGMSGRWKRYDEVHRQHVHEPEDLLELLASAGFEEVEVRDDYGPLGPTPSSLRLSFTARKQAAV